ncbi:unnamed protein product [Boreogadus saida]
MSCAFVLRLSGVGAWSIEGLVRRGFATNETVWQDCAPRRFAWGIMDCTEINGFLYGVKASRRVISAGPWKRTKQPPTILLPQLPSLAHRFVFHRAVLCAHVSVYSPYPMSLIHKGLETIAKTWGEMVLDITPYKDKGHHQLR